jgi:hypothetical protein
MYNEQVFPILIATPDYFRVFILDFCRHNRLEAISTEYPQQAIDTVMTTNLRRIILDGEWNDVNNNLKPPIVDIARGKQLPTVTLIRKARMIFDHVYHPPTHQFVTIPFSINELEAMMRRARIL